MKTNLSTVKRISATTFAILFLVCAVSAQSTKNNSNPVRKLVSLLNEYRMNNAANKLEKLTSLIEQTVKFKAPAVPDFENKATFVNYSVVSDETKTMNREESKENYQFSDSESFREWLRDQLEKELSNKFIANSGQFEMSFKVDRNGKISSCKFSNMSDPDAESTTMKIIEKSPRWKPFTCNGYLVSRLYKIAVVYKIY
jgi:hypothetical protein